MSAFAADLRHAVRAERGRTAPTGFKAKLAFVLFRPGVQAVMLYRLARWCRRHRLVPLAYAVSWLSGVLTGADLPPTADLGEGLAVLHPSGVVVAGGVRAGPGLRLHSGAVIGANEGVPVLGRDVYIGVGAKVLGQISVGDGARVGANAVVLTDVPPAMTAVGVPARSL